MNTQGIKIPFGKHKGELLTRVPISYVRWMVNETGMSAEWRGLAKAEFDRRGDTMPKVEISGHAIDNASLRVRKIWHETRGEEEGIYSWLQRITLEAIEKGEKTESGKIKYLGMKLVITQGEEFPALKTIMRGNKMEDKKEKQKQKFEPFNSVIQVCQACGKIDVCKGHEKECNPGHQRHREEQNDHD